MSDIVTRARELRDYMVEAAGRGDHLTIDYGWIVDVQDSCTCGGSGVLSPSHQPGCGTTPVIDVDSVLSALIDENAQLREQRDRHITERDEVATTELKWREYISEALNSTDLGCDEAGGQIAEMYGQMVMAAAALGQRMDESLAAAAERLRAQLAQRDTVIREVREYVELVKTPPYTKTAWHVLRILDRSAS